jgi:hypothetical protein
LWYNLKQNKAMTVVSSKEFSTHQDKYFDLAMNDHVIIQRGNSMFIVQSFIPNNEPDVIFEPDDDFYRSITADELLTGIHEDIHTFFASK